MIDPVNDPDLRRFKASGGKLLMYTGWSDAIEGVLQTIDYYETAERIVGGRAATQDFFRLFVVPGMNHCLGGEGASTIDYLSYIEEWVENERAPDKLIASHLKEGRPETFPLDPRGVQFSRPVFPFPLAARYSGNGNPNDAASFEPFEPSFTDRTTP
jgi:feruloyl esterase